MEKLLENAYFDLYHAVLKISDYLRKTNEESDKIETLYQLTKGVEEMMKTLEQLVDNEEVK